MSKQKQQNKKIKEKFGDELFITRSFNVMDFRAIESEDENKDKKVEGHAAVFDSRTNIGGWFYEIIERGAFDGCDLTDVLFFVNHNQNKIPLARSRNNNSNSTMQLSVDNTGLFVSARLDCENNEESRALYSSVSRSDIDGMSFAFRIDECRWEDMDSDMPTRYITKFKKVFEVSAVNKPAYDLTDISARDKFALDNAKLELDSARSNGLDSSKELEIEKLRSQILSK
ncbi:MAG: HK97 family phage prohead protease [Clostridium sp.]